MTDNPHYITPEEAKEIGCVMSMARENPHTIYQTCLGPECMAWRWASSFVKNKDGQIGDLDGNGYVQVFSKTHGYCGMVRP